MRLLVSAGLAPARCWLECSRPIYYQTYLLLNYLRLAVGSSELLSRRVCGAPRSRHAGDVDGCGDGLLPTRGATCAQTLAATHTAVTRAMTTPCMMRVRRATEARAGVVAGVAAASLFVPAISRLHAASASSSHKAVQCAATEKDAEGHEERGVAEEEEVNVEEVKVKVEAGVLVWIGARHQQG